MSQDESPFLRSTGNGSPFRFSAVDGGVRISFDVHAAKGERQTKSARFGKFEIICDEGLSLGGDDTAPPPLAYFAASVAF